MFNNRCIGLKIIDYTYTFYMDSISYIGYFSIFSWNNYKVLKNCKDTNNMK